MSFWHCYSHTLKGSFILIEYSNYLTKGKKGEKFTIRSIDNVINYLMHVFMHKLGNVETKDSYIEPPEIEKTYDGNKLK